MGVFWQYFKEILRWPLIASPGPLSLLVDGAAVCLDTVRDIVSDIRNQFFSTLSEAAFLGHFAKSRGIDRAPLEPDAHWLERVRFAYHWWSRGGRASSLAESLQVGFGFGSVTVISMTNHFELVDETTSRPLADESTSLAIDGGDTSRWAEFMVVAQLRGNEVRYTREQIVWAINEIKPARSRLAGLLLMAPLFDEINNASLFDETTLSPLSANI